MKKIIIILAASTFIFACNKTSKKNPQDVAQVQNVEQIKKMTIDSMRMQAQIRETKQAVIDSMNNVEKGKASTLNPLKASEKEKQVVTEHTHPTVKKANDVVAYKDNSETKTTTTTSTPAKVHKKKRKISRTVEGALIGAGVGAISGAIIDKDHRGRGALIGGVIGAGVGAGTGAILDKKAKKNENY